jgi:hypothetical protein
VNSLKATKHPAGVSLSKGFVSRVLLKFKLASALLDECAEHAASKTFVDGMQVSLSNPSITQYTTLATFNPNPNKRLTSTHIEVYNF